MKDLDQEIKKSLSKEAESMKISPFAEERMKQRVHSRIKEESEMKRISWKKTAVTAAAICLFASMAAIAAGNRFYTIGGSDSRQEFTSYSQIEKAADKAGVNGDVPEKFENGFAFKSGVPVNNRTEDESGNVMMKYTSLSLFYENQDKEQVSLYIDPAEIGMTEDGDQVQVYGDTRLIFNEDQYLMVPEGYEVSEEQLEREAAGELYISYGSSQVEEMTYRGVRWQKGNSIYNIFTWEDLTEEECFQMAKEVIDGQS